MTGEGIDNTIILSDNISDEIKKIKGQTGKDILIFGSPSVAQKLMQLDLVDSYWIFINPIIFGQGIPLFSGKAEKSKLKLLATRLFANGEIALNYIVDR
jgi:dihydrofolate reductase